MNAANCLRRSCLVFGLLAGSVTGSAHAAGAAVGAAVDAAQDAAARRVIQEMQRRAREAPLARDEVELFPELRGDVLKEDLQDRFGQAVGDSRFIVRIRQVVNLQGNNPFNVRQPLLNFNGVEVRDLAALIAIAKGIPGGGTSPLLADCIRTVPMNVILANLIWSGNFDLNPITLACTLRPPGVPGSGSFSIGADSPSTPGGTTHCVGGIGGAAWARDPAGATCVAYALGATVTFGAVSTAGKKINVQFQVTAGNPPTLRVIAITPLN